MDVGSPAALAGTLGVLLARGHALEEVLPVFTRNVARILQLGKKGRIAAGADADLVTLDGEHGIRDVMARGRFRVRAGEPVAFGTFERPPARAQIMSPARVEGGRKRGYIVPIGGAEDKEGASSILRRFLDVSGGDGARIVIIPTASKLEDTGRRYEKLFKKLGADEAKALPLGVPRRRREARSGSTTSRRRTASS